ncbi:LOW PROTEIN: M-PHASE INDUCER PHOSPHATASE-LIKE PROTEIN [Salix viminalis]|uniref:LOW PROTEIN: M-PHASE INDUCER PHOSPHATASE-LIKE PROTEIN n=1 Tax=Salix viminalis TaxID=40686 RepID=A0A9Q0NLH3_SALVM|nr:LOW PROTEIN: M-PHASE INDUCER PHOSPHATASE-LIKE PROTEIN [Salix viminalis]
MGKEYWYFCGGGKTSKKEDGGGEGRRGEREIPQQSSNVLQPNSFLPVQDPPIPRGVEAPRNSLELEEEPPLRSSKDEKFNIPIGIQIKTKGVPNDLSSSEISSSPGTKTPNLTSAKTTSSPWQKKVALEVVWTHDFSGTRSLPETPRISSARRSDVEHRLSLQINKENVIEDLVLSRLSSLKRIDLKFEEESRSPGHYARQIVKQVKESVGRKFGLDITNTERNREQTRRRDQELELISQYKSKKILSKSPSSTKIVDVTGNSPGNYHSVTTTSCSPRLKFLEPKNKPITTLPCKDHNNNSQKPSLLLSQNTKPSTKPNLPHQVLLQRQCHHQHRQRPFKKIKKVTEEKFGSPPISRLDKKALQSSDIIRTNKEDPFVLSTSVVTRANIPDKKCKKIPLSSDLNVSLPTLLPVKKDPTPPATKIPQKQVSNVAQESKWSSQLSSCSSQSYKQAQATRWLDSRETNNEDRYNNGVATNIIPTGDGGASGEEYEYITRILKRTGLDKDTPVSFTRWFSPSHPLDPSSFYYLEHLTTRKNNRTLDRRSNRKLLFDLVDEILVDILRPYINMKPWSSTRLGTFSQQDRISHMNGSHLVQMLCAKLRSFPRADCHELKDIDGLVDKDLAELKDQNEIAFGEEGERIVMDVEKNIMDTLIHETAMIFYGE